MVISFWKKIFLGTCGILLAITVVLFNTSSFYKDPRKLVYWIQGFKNSSILKKDFNHSLQSECLLPLQWTLETNSSNSSEPMAVLHMKENDICIELLIKKHCYKDKRIVPNVVHYIRFGLTRPLQIYAFLSFLATWKHIKPCFIVIHGDFPLGPLFEKFLKYKPRIMHVKKIPKTTIFGKKLSWVQHKADVARLEIILKYGGIYLDYDEIVLKSFDPLRNHSVVLGQETGNQLGNGVIVAEPSAMFIKIWMAAYHSYNPNQWAVHSTMVPFQLSKLLNHMVVIETTFLKPNYQQLDQLYKKTIDWSGFYGVHLYGKARLKKDTLETIRYQDSTYGSVARYIYYGNKTLQKKTKKH